MARQHLPELRDLLSAKMRELAGDGATSDEIVREFRKANAEAVAQAADALIEIALIKLVNEVSTRRPPASLVPGQGDLFAGFTVPTMVALPAAKADGKRLYEHKLFGKLTLPELMNWLKDRSKERAGRARQLREARRLLKRIKPLMRDGITTVEEALSQLQAAETAELEPARA